MTIKGITVVLFERIETGTDPFGNPVYTETETPVENVLVAPTSETEILDTLNLTGRRAVYTLGLPKGDTHEWTDAVVGFFGKRWHVIGAPLTGIDELVPLEWNTKIRVEAYDNGS